MNNRRRRLRKGMGIIWVVIVLTVALAMGSLAVDFGRVQLAKTQLRTAADAAARYACTGINDNTYVAKAIAAAADNSADGVAVSITSADIAKGNFNKTTRVFTANATPTNAVQINANRTGTNGIPLVIGGAIGMQRVDVHATTIAYFEPGYCSFTGLNGFDTGNGGFVGSYDSSVTTNPTQAGSTGKASFGSNGVVSGNCVINGNLQLGPGGSNAGVTFTGGGGVINSTNPITGQPDPAWTPSGNPGGVPQVYVVAGNTTLAGGTYWFTSLTITGSLTFSGAANVYVNGNVVLSGSLLAYQNRPVNLQVYQIGSNRTFGSTLANDINICAVITAPNSDFDAKNNLRYEGSGIFKTIEFKNNPQLFYDTTLGNANGITQISLVR